MRLEETRSPPTDIATSSQVDMPQAAPKRISILSIFWRILFAILIVGGAVYLATTMISNRPEPPKRNARERSFTVAVTEPEFGTFGPSVQAFGEVVAQRTIDIRVQVAGAVVEVSPNLSTGSAVAKDELLVRIDSFSYDGAVRDAQAALADARLQRTVAQEQMGLEQINFATAEEQLELGRRDLERVRSLLNSGSVTSKNIEDRELLVSQRAQTLAQRQSNIKVQEATIERQTTAISRAEWVLEKAERALANTQVRAPFDGIVVTENAGLDRVISSNEIIAQLYATNDLEVRFVLSDRQYGQLVSAGLIGRPVTAVWDIEPSPLTVSGKIVRAGAEVNASLGGVEMFARLDGSEMSLLRPGTFVEIRVEGLAYRNVLLLPEAAIYENDHFYVVRDNRMARIDAELLARDGQNVIVRASVPEGERIITTRVAQAGDGLLIAIEGEEPVRRFGGGITGEDGAQSGSDNGSAGPRGKRGERAPPEGARRPPQDGSAPTGRPVRGNSGAGG